MSPAESEALALSLSVAARSVAFNLPLAILVGYGRVGGAIGHVLNAQGLPFVVIERDHLMLASAQANGIPTIVGDAATPGVLTAAGIERARLVVVATPDSYQARRIVQIVHQLKHGIDIVVRTHSATEMEALQALQVGRVVMGERELANGMLETVCDMGSFTCSLVNNSEAHLNAS